MRMKDKTRMRKCGWRIKRGFILYPYFLIRVLSFIRLFSSAFYPPSAFSHPRFILYPPFLIRVLSSIRLFSSAFYPPSAFSHPYFLIRIRIRHPYPHPYPRFIPTHLILKSILYLDLHYPLQLHTTFDVLIKESSLSISRDLLGCFRT